MDALNIISEKKDAIELILTNLHRTYASECGIIERIEKEFCLQIIMMSPDVDDIKNAARGGGNGVTVYFMKCLSVNEMNTLWATALAREKSKKELSFGNLSPVENAGSRRTKEDNEQNGNTEKKPRVVWSKEMHQKFLEAVEQLGHDKAFPKKIVELMNVPGLTRENVASHLQKYRLCMKRAQEGVACSSYDFTDHFGFNTSQENFQQSHWNPFQTGSRNTTTTQFGLNPYQSTSRTPHHIPLLNTIRLKPDQNFRVYGDEKKNILLSIGDSSRVPQNTSFAGFRLTRDGKSVMFGQNSHIGNDGVNKSYVQFPSASSFQQQILIPEIGNNDSTHCPSFIAPPGTRGESVSFSSQLFSLAALLAVDEPVSAILTQPQPTAEPGPGFDWNKAASFIQPPSSVGSTWSNWEEPLRFTCQQLQQTIMSQSQPTGLQWTDWAEPPSLSPQQPPSVNTANANSEIFSDFSSPLPLELCELGLVADENGLDATEIPVFDDLLFDNHDLS